MKKNWWEHCAVCGVKNTLVEDKEMVKYLKEQGDSLDPKARKIMESDIWVPAFLWQDLGDGRGMALCQKCENKIIVDDLFLKKYYDKNPECIHCGQKGKFWGANYSPKKYIKDMPVTFRYQIRGIKVEAFHKGKSLGKYIGFNEKEIKKYLLLSYEDEKTNYKNILLKKIK